MENYILKNTNNPRVKFSGELIATASEETGIGTSQTFNLYKTVSGKHIGQKEMRTQWQGANDSFIVKIFNSYDDIFAFFGYGDLAKEIYNKAKIDESIEIE